MIRPEPSPRSGLFGRRHGDLPFGHVAENFMLPVGAPARLDAAGATLTVLEPAVR